MPDNKDILCRFDFVANNSWNSIKGIFNVLILIITLLYNPNVFARFGETCTGLDSKYLDKSVIDDLTNNSIFGFVKSIIDIDNCGPKYYGGCINSSRDQLTLCFKKNDIQASSANSENSNMVTLNAFTSIKLGEIAPDLVQQNENLANLILTVGPIDNRMCVVMPTQYGNAPLLCRDAIAPPTIETIAGDKSQCSEVSKSCSLTEKGVSRSPNAVFGKIVQCVYESLDIIFFDPRTCDRFNMNVITDDTSATESKIKPFADFYVKLRLIVFSGITLYIIFLGIKMMLSPNEINVNELFLAAAKVILVIYFSVGFVRVDWFSGKEKAGNGVTEFVLPMMLSFVTDMSDFLYNNVSQSNLCYFDKNDYDRLHKYYAIWDSVDCRLNTYLGINKVFHKDLSRYSRVYTKFDAPAHRPSFNFGLGDRPAQLDPEAGDTAKTEALKKAASVGWDIAEAGYAIVFFPVIFAMLLGGGFIPFLVLIFIMILIMGLLFSILMSFILSLLILYVLAYIAPIFVPMSLFQRTKGYFDGWLNLTLASTIQPVIILSFSSFLMMLIDSFLFDSCVFVKYKELVSDFYIFDLWLSDSASLAENCQKSIGYKLFQYYQLASGWVKSTFVFFEVVTLKDVWDLQGSCWGGLIIIYLLKHIMDEIYNLSSSLTNGMNLSNLVTKPTDALKAVKEGMQKIKSGASKTLNLAKSAMNSLQNIKK